MVSLGMSAPATRARVLLACALFVVPRAALAGTPGVQVDIRSDSPSATLKQVVETTGSDQLACTPPCGRWLPRDALYRISGDGVRDSVRFRLPENGKRTTLVVQTGSSARHGAGWGLIAAGGAASVAGFVILMNGWGATGPDSPDKMAELARWETHWKPIGEILSFGGVAAVATGIYLIVTSRTRVRFETTEW